MVRFRCFMWANGPITTEHNIQRLYNRYNVDFNKSRPYLISGKIYWGSTRICWKMANEFAWTTIGLAWSRSTINDDLSIRIHARGANRRRTWEWWRDSKVKQRWCSDHQSNGRRSSRSTRRCRPPDSGRCRWRWPKDRPHYTFSYVPDMRRWTDIIIRWRL